MGGPAKKIGRAAVRPVRIGVGGWVFAPWRETFYPPGLRSADWLGYASRQLTSTEVNATFYRTQTEATFRAWHDATPDGFVFALKGPRAATQTRDPERTAAGVARFLGSGITALGGKLGPIAWQFAPTRKFVRDELAAFLDLLPPERDGLPLRHAIEAAHESFRDPECTALLRERGVARVLLGVGGDLEPDETATFVYARLKGTVADHPSGFAETEFEAWTARIGRWRAGRDCFVYVISGAKAHNPAAARELLRRLGEQPAERASVLPVKPA